MLDVAEMVKRVSCGINELRKAICQVNVLRKCEENFMLSLLHAQFTLSHMMFQFI